MTQQSPWTLVCGIDQIVPNTGVCAKVGNAQVAVFRLCPPDGGAEQLYAIGNVDPLSGASVLSRGLVGDVAGQIVVASPVYKHHYALATGACLEDERASVPVYAVQLVDGAVLVGTANP